MPCTLHTRALNHAVFAEESARFVPLAADAMQQSIGVAFLGGEASVLVPDTGNAMPVTVSERHLFAEQTVSIPGLLNRGSHVRCFCTSTIEREFWPI